MRTSSTLLAGLFFLATLPATAAVTCESLSSLKLPDGSITSAQTVAAGTFKLPGARGEQNGAVKNLPAFCRVAATLTPTSDSDIKIEVWLPISNWNRKYQAVGNGGWAGSISYPEMMEALQRGYATSSTDTGHTGATGSFAMGHPEKLIDFGYRAVHEMTVKSKSIIKEYYGSAPQYSYWNGCSTGGRQGLREAQRFPGDFDGIIAGAAANPRTRLASWELWVGQATLKDSESYIPKSKYPMVHQAVIAQCDETDGLKDGLIQDPRQCRFDPKVLLCKAEDGPTCLTAPQVRAATQVMGTPKNSKTGEEIYPGLEPGTELGWSVMAGGPRPFSTAVDQFKYVVYKDPNWDWHNFDIERDVVLADKTDNDTINVPPDLKGFKERGAKLLMYHGWSDPNVAPRASINFYNTAVDKLGGPAKNENWIRLFMEPGMGHCRGGEGPNTFDTVTALEQWVEQKKAPDQMIASHSTNGKVDRTRPLCPYPQIATYKGSGSIDDAANFQCKVNAH